MNYARDLSGLGERELSVRVPAASALFFGCTTGAAVIPGSGGRCFGIWLLEDTRPQGASART